MADTPAENPKNPKRNPAEASPAPDERAARLEAAGKVEKGRKILEKAEKNQVSFEINKNNMDRWTVVLEQHLKRALGDEYSSDHLFTALQFLRASRFEGKNLFEAVKREVAKKGTLTVMLEEKDLQSIREQSGNILGNRVLIAKEWKKFCMIQRPTAKTPDIPQKTDVPETATRHIDIEPERTFSFNEMLRSLDVLRKNLGEAVVALMRVKEKYLKPGEGIWLYPVLDGVERRFLYGKNTDGVLALNGITFEDLLNGNKDGIPETLSDSTAGQYVVISAKEMDERELTGESQFRTEFAKLNPLDEQSPDESFFGKLHTLAETYKPIEYSFIRIIYHHGERYMLMCDVICLPEGIIAYATPMNPDPSGLDKESDDLDASPRYPDIKAFGRRIMDMFPVNEAQATTEA